MRGHVLCGAGQLGYFLALILHQLLWGHRGKGAGEEKDTFSRENIPPPCAWPVPGKFLSGDGTTLVAITHPTEPEHSAVSPPALCDS